MHDHQRVGDARPEIVPDTAIKEALSHFWMLEDQLIALINVANLREIFNRFPSFAESCPNLVALFVRRWSFFEVEHLSAPVVIVS